MVLYKPMGAEVWSILQGLLEPGMARMSVTWMCLSVPSKMDHTSAPTTTIMFLTGGGRAMQK